MRKRWSEAEGIRSDPSLVSVYCQQSRKRVYEFNNQKSECELNSTFNSVPSLQKVPCE